MSIPSILPNVEGDSFLDDFRLCLQDPQSCQDVVWSIDKQVPNLDVEEAFEVHGEAELDKHAENLQWVSLQTMFPCPHEAKSLGTSQPPNKEFTQIAKNQSQQILKSNRAWQRGPHFMSCISSGRLPDLRAWTSL